MKKLDTKPTLKSQIFWFVGLYVASILALTLFHFFSGWLIAILK